jgi:pyruvate formate lyase activating enzyme
MDGKGATPTATLERAYEIGKEAGLRYIYIGNLPGMRAESTFCYECGEILIERVGYTIRRNAIEQGACPKCKAEVKGFEL